MLHCHNWFIMLIKCWTCLVTPREIKPLEKWNSSISNTFYYFYTLGSFKIYRNYSECKYQLGIVKTFQIIEGHLILLNLKQIEFDNCASCRGEKDKWCRLCHKIIRIILYFLQSLRFNVFDNLGPSWCT